MLRLTRTFALAALLTALAAPARAADAAPKVGEATRDADGFLVHRVECDYQDKPTAVRVLLPGKVEPGRRYRVLYVLPVEAGDGKQYGDGLLEVKKRGLHDRYGLICVQPTFARVPWYADHPTDPKVRQESYFLKVVVPFVEDKYPALARPEVLPRQVDDPPLGVVEVAEQAEVDRGQLAVATDGVGGDVLGEGLALLAVLGQPVAGLRRRQRPGQRPQAVLDLGIESFLITDFAHSSSPAVRGRSLPADFRDTRTPGTVRLPLRS
jgi:hypothetical protein